MRKDPHSGNPVTERETYRGKTGKFSLLTLSNRIKTFTTLITETCVLQLPAWRAVAGAKEATPV